MKIESLEGYLRIPSCPMVIGLSRRVITSFPPVRRKAVYWDGLEGLVQTSSAVLNFLGPVERVEVLDED